MALIRDMTDTMYDHRMKPRVDHFTGTDLVVAARVLTIESGRLGGEIIERGRIDDLHEISGDSDGMRLLRDLARRHVQYGVGRRLLLRRGSGRIRSAASSRVICGRGWR